MEFVLAGLIGALFSLGVYMILRGSIVSVVIGIIMLSHGTNLFVFTITGLKNEVAPVLSDGTHPETVADPLPHALILTAIVISFGITAYTIVLVRSVYQTIGKENINQMRSSDLTEE